MDMINKKSFNLKNPNKQNLNFGEKVLSSLKKHSKRMSCDNRAQREEKPKIPTPSQVHPFPKL